MHHNLTAAAGTGSIGEPAQAAFVPERASQRNRLQILLFVMPALLFQLFWGWYPFIVAFILSFTNYKIRGPLEWVGTRNYQRVLNDPLVEQAFMVTLKYALLSIALTFVVPILIAIFLMEAPNRLRRWMMLLWFLPLSGIASTILWRYAYNTKYGLMQYIVTSLGLPEQRFLNDANMVLFWLVFPGLLLFGPGLIYLAALQGIPQSYYEAAEVEGAGFWRKIWTISLPRLRPVISMMLTFALIGTLQIFDWPRIMTGEQGQPGGNARTVVMYLYLIWQRLRFGDAMALAVVLFAVIMTLTIVYRILIKEDPDA